MQAREVSKPSLKAYKQVNSRCSLAYAASALHLAKVSVDSAHEELKAIIAKLDGKKGQELVDAFAVEAKNRSDCGSFSQAQDVLERKLARVVT